MEPFDFQLTCRSTCIAYNSNVVWFRGLDVRENKTTGSNSTSVKDKLNIRTLPGDVYVIKENLVSNT